MSNVYNIPFNPPERFGPYGIAVATDEPVGAIPQSPIAGLAAMLIATMEKQPSVYTSRQRNTYCHCGKRVNGRALKFKDCCGHK